MIILGHITKNNFVKAKDAKKTFSRLLKYLFKQKKLLVVFVFCLIINAITICLAPTLTAFLIDKLILIKDWRDILRERIVFGKYIFLLGLIYFIDVISDYVYRNFVLRLSQRTVNNLKKDLFSHVKFLPVKYFHSVKHGDIMSRFTNDMDNITDALNESLPNLISGLIILSGCICVMFFRNKILMLCAILMLIISFFLAKIILSVTRKYFRVQQKNLGELNAFVEESFECQKVIKAFCYENNIKDKFDIYNKSYKEIAIRAQTYSGFLEPIMFNINNINYAVTTMIGAILILNNLLTIGGLVSFLQLIREMAHPVAHLSGQIAMIQSALAGTERIFDVMDEKLEDINILENKNLVLNKNDKYDVEFKNVVFGYDEKKIVLDNISFKAEAGKKIALVGATGAGKTTIAGLINRFYDVNHGEIKINNKNIKEFDLNELRSLVGVVLQDTHLFEMSVLENIRYGKLNATDQECIDAAKLANADGFIKNLANGYESVIYNDGENLSQGQRQLLNIARMAVSDAKILILDEATSSVDTRTEKLIQEGLDKLMIGKTSFIIAHRLSTIRNCDLILVIEKGKIIEAGNHDELIKNKLRYYDLCCGQYDLD